MRAYRVAYRVVFNHGGAIAAFSWHDCLRFIADFARTQELSLISHVEHVLVPGGGAGCLN